MPDSAAVFTLSDLESWSAPGVNLAVLGHPIKHSLSPAMHNAALATLAGTDPRFHDWRYSRFDIHPDDLPRALELFHAKKFRGLNLTVPHKVIAFGRVAEIDAAAQSVGAVNTLDWTQAGWKGFNTDGYGLTSGVRATLGRDLATSPVILLGAGGAARGAAVECLRLGCPALWIANRTRENLESLLSALTPLARNTQLEGFFPGTPVHFPPGTLVINATSAGLRPADPAPIDLAALPRPAGVYDMIDNPPRTSLLLQAEKMGIPWANGLTMLVHQGAKSLEVWTGVPASRTAPTMLAAAQAALGA